MSSFNIIDKLNLIYLYLPLSAGIVAGLAGQGSQANQ